GAGEEVERRRAPVERPRRRLHLENGGRLARPAEALVVRVPDVTDSDLRRWPRDRLPRLPVQELALRDGRLRRGGKRRGDQDPHEEGGTADRRQRVLTPGRHHGE